MAMLFCKLPLMVISIVVILINWYDVKT